MIPRDLAPALHELLRTHFADDESVAVVVERRATERRTNPERRQAPDDRLPDHRRRIRNPAGRRVAERRATTVRVDRRDLPRRARRYAERLVFLERLEPRTQDLEERDTARLVARFQAGDEETFAELYLRYFAGVYRYLCVALNDEHEAEDAAQQVFMKVFRALPRYEQRGRPFKAWLFRIVRNHAISAVRSNARSEVTAPEALDAERIESESTDGLEVLRWISDAELLMFIERLPLAQRQVLMLRFMLDLPHSEIADIMGRRPVEVRKLQHRALQFLRVRLVALGRTPTSSKRCEPSQRLVRRVRVLRARRFALSP